jgi:hypothetical protein
LFGILIFLGMMLLGNAIGMFGGQFTGLLWFVISGIVVIAFESHWTNKGSGPVE